MKLRAIPKVPSAGEQRSGFDTALKENLEQITGRRSGAIAPLNADTATLADVVAKINEMLEKTQSDA